MVDAQMAAVTRIVVYQLQADLWLSRHWLSFALSVIMLGGVVLENNLKIVLVLLSPNM